MKYKRNVIWKHKTDGIVTSSRPEDTQSYERFDSNFEFSVYENLEEFCSSHPYRLKRQYPVPLVSKTFWVKPVRNMVWKCDFALFRERPMVDPDLGDIPSLLIEAKGQVSRDFKLTLGMVSPKDMEILTIICSDQQGIDEITRCLTKHAPIHFAIRESQLSQVLKTVV